MTITTLEEHDEAAQLPSEPSSPVLDVNSGEQEITGSTGLFREMKFEMRATKGALPNPMHDRLKSGLPTSLNSVSIDPLLLHGHPSNADRLSAGIARSQSASITGKYSSPRYQQPLRMNSASIVTENSSNRPNEKEASYNARSTNATARSVSTDTVDSMLALSTRTRLRRQRRMGSQDSTELSEDPMERLNRLRARISGALSEVKGVLNKYSTEAEPNDEVSQKDQKLNVQEPQAQQPQADNGPIQFRFVKKIRRRSLFNEDEEDKSNERTEVEQKTDNDETTPKSNNIALQSGEEQMGTGKVEKTFAESSEKLIEDSRIEGKVTKVLPETIVPTIEIATVETVPLKTVVVEEKSAENKKDSNNSNGKSNQNKKLTVQAKNEKRRVSIGTVEEIDSQHVPQTIKVQRRPSDSVAVIKKPTKNDIKPVRVIDKILEKVPKKVQNEETERKATITKDGSSQKEVGVTMRSNTVKATLTDRTQDTVDKAITKLKNNENICPKEPLPSAGYTTQTESKEANQLVAHENVTQQDKKVSLDNSQSAQTKSGKRLSVKKSDSIRRSSIAVVERSKIEPPIIDNIPPELKMRRRPSDSEAILKKTAVRSPEIRAEKSLADNKITTAATLNDKYRTQIKRSASEKPIKETPSKIAELIAEKITESPVTNVENSCKDDAATSSAADKQSVVLPNHSITVINNETSITSSMPVGASLATVIGRATTATATTAETAITPPVKKTEIFAATKDSKFPLITDGHEIANVAVPPSLSKINEASSQQAQLYQIPNVQSTSEIRAISLEKSIPLSTDSTLNKNVDPKWGRQAISSSAEQAIKPVQAVSTNGAINHHVTTKTEKATNSIGNSNRAETQAASKNDHIKKPIHQQEIIPATIKASSPSPLLTSSSPLLSQPTVEESLPQASASASVSTAAATSAQQVSVNAELAVIATVDDICAHDRVPEISETTPKKSLSEVNVAALSEIAVISKESSIGDVATKTSATAITPDSAVENITTSLTATKSLSTEPETEGKANMPELQVLHRLHSDTQVPPPFGESKEIFPKKKVLVKKVIRKNCTEKPQISKTTTDEDQAAPTKEPAAEAEILPALESTATTDITGSTDGPLEEEQHTATPNSTRKIKKKVIIKRLQRKLSGSEQTFFLGPSEEKTTTDVETLEKAIAYVTDDEVDEEPAQPIQPLKSCMRIREYQVGDLVMYAERYKKTQIRWKKGRITERITSISYKLDIDGKEVSAHINYLKKYTGRKVRFGGKEYLEIDYEQIAEEEKKARNYSIWNLV